MSVRGGIGLGLAIPRSPLLVPITSTISPSSVYKNDPASTLTVNGANFIPSSVIKIDGVAQATTFVSNIRLTCPLPVYSTVSTKSITVGASVPLTLTVNEWIPATIANYKAHYRADVLITLVGADVSVWGDASGSGDSNKNALQATSSKRPLWVASSATFGNMPVVHGDVTPNDILQTLTWASPVTGPWTMYAVWRYGTSAPDETYNVLWSDLGYTIELYGYLSTNISGSFGSASLLKNVRAYSCFTTIRLSVSQLYSNNNFTTPSVETSAGSYPTINGLALLNEDPSGGYSVDGDLAELILYSGDHDQTTRNIILNYFRARYGA